MLPRRDLVPYLVAIKSLYAEVKQGRVAVINERSVVDHNSLTDEDLAVLRHHVPGIEIIDFCAISTGRCPRGGTWERLVKIIELTKENYVIQVDADTLVSEPIPEVLDCVQANRSFILGTDVGLAVSPAPQTAKNGPRLDRDVRLDATGYLRRGGSRARPAANSCSYQNLNQ